MKNSLYQTKLKDLGEYFVCLDRNHTTLLQSRKKKYKYQNMSILTARGWDSLRDYSGRTSDSRSFQWVSSSYRLRICAGCWWWHASCQCTQPPCVPSTGFPFSPRAYPCARYAFCLPLRPAHLRNAPVVVCENASRRWLDWRAFFTVQPYQNSENFVCKYIYTTIVDKLNNCNCCIKADG